MLRSLVPGALSLALLLALGWLLLHPHPRLPERPAPDLDGDGVADALDACAREAGLLPDGCPPRDSDGDGALDRDDECPERPGPPGNRGCPDRDGDGDGVVDRGDRCPAQAGHPEAEGCAPADSDEDGFWDAEDACPEQAEVWNGRDDVDGCPDPGAARLEVAAGRIAPAGPAWFSRSGRLTRAGRVGLQRAAAVLHAARARRVRVQVAMPGSGSGTAPQRRAEREAAAAIAVLAHERPGLALEREDLSGEGAGFALAFE
ncbi:thrombospondin type 3 repeat-containing protein [Haliangium ochraceum]|uniref:Thrombospondin type 3 repeat protein n=1 Tax=Haliangium ochraceum (strain DSM 14365 / JCM 11303 / SMP-2) TaxID=502025 RepID=D0LZE2_HALO1|nr:thrombospondin type 3 repeat-containing protein [Haliangium ochraceum]ACY16404.1 Thrombospondin type 3 repeat protein [Haliangium ochraceum DSM 14365]